jgi:hypothetical protein
MLFSCPTVQANFPTEKLCLANRTPARLVWDEHGGTFVLRVEGLEALEAPELQGEVEIRLEVALPAPAALAREIEGFAGRHALRLAPGPFRVEFSETPFLAAGHIPGKNVFIYCEEPRLTVRRRETQVMELGVTGAFKSRRVPCQETDVVIHLDGAAMARLLAGLLAWARQGKLPGAG